MIWESATYQLYLSFYAIIIIINNLQYCDIYIHIFKKNHHVRPGTLCAWEREKKMDGKKLINYKKGIWIGWTT